MGYKSRYGFFFLGIAIALITCPASPVWAKAEAKGSEPSDPGFYYTIKKGDTLWDLSQKFYSSQWDWPGLWEMNKDIKNPHWIYPGKQIRVYLKSGARPAPQSAPAQPQAQQTTQAQPDPVSPEYYFPPMNRVGFIKKSTVNSLGTIVRERDGNQMMATGDIIYIRPTNVGALIPGEQYQIFETEEISEKFNKERFNGIKHLIKADIEILKKTEEYARAIIRKTYRDVNVGDSIMTFYRRNDTLDVEEKPAPIDAFILCSEDNTVMVNDYRIAFINKGSRDNIRPGQIYAILQSQEDQSVFDGKDSIYMAPLFSGELIILHTEETSSTVKILSSVRDIHPGDMVN